MVGGCGEFFYYQGIRHFRAYCRYDGILEALKEDKLLFKERAAFALNLSLTGLTKLLCESGSKSWR